MRPAVGDVVATSEGAERAVVSEDGGLQLFDGKGDLISGFPWIFDTETIAASPLLADITGDGLKEIVLIMRNASSAYSLKAFTATKTLLGSWSAPASAVIYYDPVAAKHEIVGEDITLTTTDGNVYTLRYQSGAL